MTDQLFPYDGVKPPRAPKGQEDEPMVKLKPPWVLIRRANARPIAHRSVGLHTKYGGTLALCGASGAVCSVEGEPLAVACPKCLGGRMKPTVRATSLAQQAALSDADLRAGDDIVDNPQRADEATVQGHFDLSACTHFLATFWALWDDTDEGAL